MECAECQRSLLSMDGYRIGRVSAGGGGENLGTTNNVAAKTSHMGGVIIFVI